MLCFRDEQSSRKAQHLLPADPTSGENKKKKNGITESLTSPVEFENGAVRQGN